MENKNGISIIMPVYNSEKFLKKTIESVLNQTFKNFELILIENGSTDNSLNICKEFLKKDNRIILKEVFEPGVSNARNIGIEYSKFEKIMFIDSDDLYDEEIVERLNEDNETECNICFFEKFRIEERIKRRKKYKVPDFKNFCELIGFLHKKDLFNTVWNKIYLKEILQKNDIKFDTNLSIAEDLKFNLEYFSCIKNVKILDESLYYYRINENGLNLKKHKDRIDVRKSIYYLEKEMFIKKEFDLNPVYKEYLKICFAELKQINKIYETNKKRCEEIEKLLVNVERKKELSEIYGKSNIICKFFILFLNNKLILKIFAKIIEICNL